MNELLAKARGGWFLLRQGSAHGRISNMNKDGLGFGGGCCVGKGGDGGDSGGFVGGGRLSYCDARDGDSTDGVSRSGGSKLLLLLSLL